MSGRAREPARRTTWGVPARLLSAALLAACLAAASPADDGPPVGLTDAQVADLIVDLGADAEHVRDQAREQLGRAGAAAVPALVAALRGENARVRVEAAGALGLIGSQALDAVPALEEAVAGKDDALVAAAKSALASIDPARFGAAGGAVVPVESLLAALASGDAAVRSEAIRRLGDVRGAEAQRAALALEPLLGDADLAVRRLALRSFAGLGPAAAASAPRLVDVLVAGGAGIRPLALDALVRMPDAAVEPAIRALARLHEAQADPTGARPWVGAVLWDAGAGSAAPARAALASDEAFLAAAGAEALGDARATDAESVAALIAAARTGTGVVRRTAARALGSLGAGATDAGIDALVALVADRDSRAQVEAADALRRILADLAERPFRPSRTPADAQRALEAGVNWLVSHQDEDGRWDADGFERHDPAGDRSGGPGKDVHDAGVTALASLALVRSGATGRVGPGDTWSDTALRRGLAWLVETQQSDGRIGLPGTNHWIYAHAIGTLALTEAWARTRHPVWGHAAQRGVDFLAEARNPEGGWRYDVRPKDADTSVSGWAVQALRTGERAGLRADRSGYDPVLRFLDSCTDRETGAVGYQPHIREPARTNETKDRFPPAKSEAMTASACLQRLLLGRDPRSDPVLEKGLERILRLPPRRDDPGSVDLYSWMAATDAFALAGGDGARRWRTPLRETLVALQCGPRTGARAGSWDLCDAWGPDGGRIYTTAAAVLCLEAHQGWIAPLPRDPTTFGPGLRAARALAAAAADTANHEAVRDAARAALAPYGGR